MSFYAKAWQATQRPVPRSEEFRRIAGLRRRELGQDPPDGWLEQFRLRSGGMEPNLVQRIALYEAEQEGGLLGSLGLGSGKGPLGPWLAMVWGARRPVLLVPSKLVRQTEEIVELLSPYWRIPERLTVLGYGMLSHKNHANILTELRPDAIIADEAHMLSNRKSACHRRVAAAMRTFRPKFAGMTGTIVSTSQRDWFPLAAWALGERSPAPLTYRDQEAFAWALDRPPFDDLEPAPPGALLDFVEGDETVLEAYQRRVLDTPGVVATEGMSCSAAIVIEAVRTKCPKSVEDALSNLRRTWSRPDGEYFDSPLRLADYARQVAQGFYLRWNPPPPSTWLDARRAWAQETRAALGRKYHSPGMYEDAVLAGSVKSPTYAAWAAVRGDYRQRTEVVWLSDFVLEACEQWLAAGPPGVVWSWHPSFGRALAERTGLAYWGEGDSIPQAGLPGDVSIIASADAQGVGTNLQAFSRCLVTRCPSRAKELEQVIGRLHRPGQRASTVTVSVFVHTPELEEALESCRANAQFVRDSWRQPQRLLAASYVGLTSGGQ